MMSSDPNAAKVKLMVVYGFARSLIARRLKISEAELQELYSRELETAGPEADAMVAGNLMRSAIQGNLAAICFLLKVRAGWSETAHREQTGGSSEPTIPSPSELRLAVLRAGFEFVLPELIAEAGRRELAVDFQRLENYKPTVTAAIRDQLKRSRG